MPRIKINHSDPSVDMNIRIVLQLEQVFEPYHMIFRELKGENKKQLVSAKKRNTVM
jgi:hypothetical protein